LGNGLTENWTFGTAQKQPTQLAVSGVNASWTWGYGADSTDNGNVMSAGIAANGVNVSQSFGYDKINRLTGSSETGGPGWTRNYGYDNWANGWVTANSGLTLASTTPVASSNFDANNRLNIMSSAYDVAGNQTGIASSVSAYDAENRQISYALGGVTTTYTYDGDGRRIKKVSGSTTTVYVYDAQGQLAAEYAPVQPAACVTCYLTADTLGSTRMITDETGTPRECHDYLPFGEEIARTGAGACYTASTSNTLKFTGKERDVETGLDYFGARYLSAAQGRWTIPDWSARQDPVPYATVADPQTLNLYAYVRNNPLSRPDLDGHCPPDNPNCQDLKPNPLDAVSPEAHKAINDSVDATKKDDKEGKPTEHGGRVGRDANGNEVVVPAKPGPPGDVKKSEELTIDTSLAADPSQQGKIKGQPEIDWHTHPGATASVLVNDAKGSLKMDTKAFMQPPSPGNDILGASAKLNIVIGVRVDTLYVYDTGGTKCQESLRDFNKQQ
jgi:RHS repeat-associated protein